jgi:hypothetical protein
MNKRRNLETCGPEITNKRDTGEPEILWHLAVIWRKGRYLAFVTRECLNFTRQRLQEAGARH